MNEQALIYEVKSAATKNAAKLFSNDQKFFYWNDSKFKYLNENDYVFVVNKKGGWVLFARFLKKRIKTTLDNNRLVASFSYRGKLFEPKAPNLKQLNNWKHFIEFEVIRRIQIPDKWDWKSLGSSETTYINGNKVDSKNQNRVLNIDQLRQLTDFELYQEVLRSSEANFTDSKTLIDPPNKMKKEARTILNYVYKHIKNSGFRYQYEEIANFFLSLKTKPFVILAGISGTGKTQLPRKFAEAVGMSRNQLIQIPVRPDWTDASELIGYTALDGSYKPKPLTNAIKEAISNKAKPYFLILDEMNLARVEHYFSDFLSIIETRTRDNGKIITDPLIREEELENAINKGEFLNLYWPENLYLIGTVNMDETTHSFSRKVLDRANTIEMNEVDLNWLNRTKLDESDISIADNSLFKSEFIQSTDLDQSSKNMISDQLIKLININEILKIGDMHFAYRVRDEVAYYLIYAAKYELLELNQALDYQMVQKILPRIHGSSLRIQIILIKLLNLLAATTYNPKTPDIDDLRKRKTDLIEQTVYKRAVSKIIFMIERFEEDRFTSFWL